LLEQLRGQTVRPVEVIVVDQTPADQRDLSLAAEFADLPLVLLHQDAPGQCSSRNAGLARARGDYLLLLDDDVEVPAGFVEAHLLALSAFGADASSGVVYEPGETPPDPARNPPRASSVFPAGNTLLRREVLERTGLFDLAYERGARADGDLGMRLYLAGALMVLSPGIAILHHRAPSGGLRLHGERVVTAASSRRALFQRNLPSVSELYLEMRYFPPWQVREMLWIRLLTTLRAHGGGVRRAAKLLVGLAFLPHSAWEIRRRRARAAALLETFPQIPRLR
jgi:glycosyltransferase involved in cell wall biosynthesis